MAIRHPLLMLLLAAPAIAQSNAVPGTDVWVYNVSDARYYGRRGPAYPNGEIGFVIGHSFCNAGSVNIPWAGVAGGVMADTYPKVAFLLARESDGRIVQVSGRSYVKHSTAAFNFSSGPCAPCMSTGGPFMFVGCSDTYSSGINSNRLNLGPPEEIDPWLGTFDSVGSYFDRGDPALTGPAAMDGVKSLTFSQTGTFDDVKNRVEVRESELAVSGASYWAQVQVVIKGEPVANRTNNASTLPITIQWNGSEWVTGSNGSAQTGSVLTRWNGATWDVAGNGQDDGRFLVAVKVTGPVAGMWHYEYAVHNLDNSRGAATLRVPVDASATIQNIGVRDIDDNPLNDWTATRSGGELSFMAGTDNPIEWNNLYNFWFDCSVGPSIGAVTVDQARPGPGAVDVSVASEVPSGVSTARVASVGEGCGSCAASAFEWFPTSAGFDLANSAMTFDLNGNEYSVTTGSGPGLLPPAGSPLQLGVDSEVVVNLPFALPYPGGNTTTMRVCSNGFVSPAASNGTAFTPSAGSFLAGNARWAAAWHDFNVPNGGQVLFDASPAGATLTWNNVADFGSTGRSTFQFQFLPDGTVHLVWGAMSSGGNGYLVGWTPGSDTSGSVSSDISARLGSRWELCASGAAALSLSADARPVLGTTVGLTTSGIPQNATAGTMLIGFMLAATPIDLAPIGMDGCFAYGTGTMVPIALPTPPGASERIDLSIPNNPSIIGLNLLAQTFLRAPNRTPLGVVGSNGLLISPGLQ